MPTSKMGDQYLQLPADTTANRPGTPAAGMHRYNTTAGRPEYYSAADGWVGFGDTYGTQTNPATNATQLYNSGTTQSGWYYLKGTGTTAYQVYCDMSSAGGKWMLLWQFPNGFSTDGVNEFNRTTSVTNSTPGALESNSTFTIPISTFSPNGTGTDLDIYCQAYQAGAWRRVGAYWRGVPMNELWASTNTTFSLSPRTISTSGDGVSYTSASVTLMHSSAWEGITYSNAGSTTSYGYDTPNGTTGGIIFHDNTSTTHLYGYLEGIGSQTPTSTWTYARVWIRVY